MQFVFSRSSPCGGLRRYSSIRSRGQSRGHRMADWFDLLVLRCVTMLHRLVPFVEDVRFALLVFASVRLSDRAESMQFVEATSARVALESP